jgi:hypothetical protein
MVFIDAAHSHPHPLFDLICSIPFLHDESIVMLHDVVDYLYPQGWGESLVFTAWTDKKYRTVAIPANGDKPLKTTLGSIKIPLEKPVLYENIRRVAKIPFRASPWNFGDNYLGVDDEVLGRLRSFMGRHYEKDFAEEIYGILKKSLDEYRDNWILYHHETRLLEFLFKENASLKQAVTQLQQGFASLYGMVKALEGKR